eukprot:GEMP01122251.1.p1 GENE.GEMP01122251.1~~GEMP01122251.1.p1  ORF type:complete len:129 (+),score=32.87 GEMP01122251.1:82-468(+)
MTQEEADIKNEIDEHLDENGDQVMKEKGGYGKKRERKRRWKGQGGKGEKGEKGSKALSADDPVVREMQLTKMMEQKSKKQIMLFPNMTSFKKKMNDAEEMLKEEWDKRWESWKTTKKESGRTRKANKC